MESQGLKNLPKKVFIRSLDFVSTTKFNSIITKINNRILEFTYIHFYKINLRYTEKKLQITFNNIAGKNSDNKTCFES